ncbi:MAG: MATE family efflux transporter [Eubacterium sp.]|nr:MATE family efflux transporter [Eubacterium sp.]
MNTKEKMRVRNMTEGNPLSHILLFAIPLFIGNIFQQIYSIVDQMVAGHCLGDGAIAAIGATSALYGLMINLASGLNNGYAITVTQSFGAGDGQRLRRSIAGMIMLDAGSVVIITTLSLVFMEPLLRFMNTPENIFYEAYSYIAVICGGMGATICYNMVAGILRAVGNSRTPLYFLMLSSGINIGLDLLFVAVLGFGIIGTAVATVIAQTVSACAAGTYLLKNYRDILPEKEDFSHIPASTYSALLSTGISMGLMYCMIDIGSVIFQRANNELGEAIITAHTAARRWIMVFMQPLTTVAQANATFVGQNWGAGKKDRIRRAMRQVMGIELLWCGFSAAVIFLLGGLLVSVTTGSNDIQMIDNAVLSLKLHVGFFPFVCIIFVLRNAMQAMGKKVVPVSASCIELAMKIGAASVLIPMLGFLGTSLTEPLTWVVMMAFLSVAYLLMRKGLFGIDKTA